MKGQNIIGFLSFAAFVLMLPAMAATVPDAKTPEVDFTESDFNEVCVNEGTKNERGRIICADIAGLDQTLVYNRFGSFNPFGMMFALRRDLSPLVDPERPPKRLSAADCSGKTGTEPGNDGSGLSAGKVRLKDCKRPRPMTLRVNVGDTLLVRVTNFLYESETEHASAPDFSRNFCKGEITDDESRERVRAAVSFGDEAQHRHAEVSCLNRQENVDHVDTGNTGTADELLHAANGEAQGEPGKLPAETEPRSTHSDWPNTRTLNFVVQGLTPLPDPVSNTVHGACSGIDAIKPDESFYCRYRIEQEGTYFLASPAAPAGGEGDGGSIVHGLFGAIIAEREGSRWYRSQTSSAGFDAVWPKQTRKSAPRHSRTGLPDYEKTDANGIPYLNMAKPLDGTKQHKFERAKALEIVHSDLNAIVFCDATAKNNDCRPGEAANPNITKEPAYPAFREFSVFFHDELKTFYTKNFQDIEALGQMSGVKDGFALNYGASGMGTILMANRKGIGPAADCAECLYEEFFLTSWANGDPALLERFSDDPSNVHHSYLNDPVVFRNFHAGPKETHVFHLHAHQWFAGNDPSRGSYLDSQTVAPQQGFSYNIYHGGLNGINQDSNGWWDTQGSGNRNRTIGDSIFHCHLYPHFAQGMWALWRVHDVLEDGTRKLPDGQSHDGLSVDFPDVGTEGHKRSGSVDRLTGDWLPEQEGTPIPAIVPLPGEALPLLPTYAKADNPATPMPGYPFYIAGEPGHRPPQAPLDIAQALGDAPAQDAAIDDRTPNGEWLDGGLGRHVIKTGSERKLAIATPDVDITGLDKSKRAPLVSQIVNKSFALGDLSGHLSSANIELLDNVGTRMERAAMGFHYNGKLFDPDNRHANDDLQLVDACGIDSEYENGSYRSLIAEPPTGKSLRRSIYSVNASAPKPGAPFADPCGAPDSLSESVTLANGDPLFGAGDGWPGFTGATPAYSVDPFLLGFRRYEVSAVQLDMIVNQAGWHDPQARINVLTANSDNYKDARYPDRISPVISDREEPFFFRALSGECIEFRHTNETPKELELDDFQVKTPTDTIGQHIHLVKFDVTSSDGSGNGWNYEDGTFAPDELSTRRCAGTLGEITGDGSFRDPVDGECEDGNPTEKSIWRLPLSEHREKFQTTVQRWFADPVLSKDEARIDQDRTLRTVFTHDHFGPSSVQQHGFYSALLIEPGVSVEDDGSVSTSLSQICESSGTECVSPLAKADRLDTVAWSADVLTGSRKQVKMKAQDPLHPDYREFALAVADFALLYDPRDRSSRDDFTSQIEPEDSAAGLMAATNNQGMKRLYCEAKWRLSPVPLEYVCGNHPIEEKETHSWFFEGDIPPAWIAGGAHRDDLHDSRFDSDIIVSAPGEGNEVAALREHAIAWREKAAGMYGKTDAQGKPLASDVATLANPVAPPLRPESISVDHHDPYLINYRGAPIPLRIGDKQIEADAPLADRNRQSEDCKPLSMARLGSKDSEHEETASEVVAALESGEFSECSIHRQVEGANGDLAGVMRSALHGDPETPVLEAYEGERMVFRLIQGAQEVQHMFNVAGQPFKRNIDQAFARGMQPLGLSARVKSNPSIRMQCFDALSDGKPSRYREWLDSAPSVHEDNPNAVGNDPYWQEYEKLLASCDNMEGFTFAQEIGISEHFEMQGSLRSDISASVERAALEQRTPEPVIGAAAAGAAEPQAPEGFADYLYNFGTVDALWNGAWGLLRIFDGPDSIDPMSFVRADAQHTLTNPDTVQSTPVAIRERLGDSQLETVESADNGDSIETSTVSGLSCPLPTNENLSRHTEAVIVAVETRRLWSDGTNYSGPRHDPDGLMLALLNPESLVEGGFRADESDWENLSAAKVLAAIKDNGPYQHGPVPFTLRVNAGDCVRLRIVNLLEEHNGQGLRDLLGDAELPPIVPLNADPAFGGVSFEDNEQLADGVQRIGRLEKPEGSIPASGLRPSASLALSIGLPGMNLIRDVPLAFGYNKPAIPPASATIAVSEELRFYAGRFRMDLKTDDDMQVLVSEIKNDIVDYMLDKEGGWLQTGQSPFPQPGTSAEVLKSALDVVSAEELAASSGLFDVLGEKYVIELFIDEIPGFPPVDGGDTVIVLDGSDESKRALSLAYCFEAAAPSVCIEQADMAYQQLADIASLSALQQLNERTHWIPYAFGLVPIQSTSDVISHAQHGLFGAINVLPQNWRLGAAHGVVHESRVGQVIHRSMTHIDYDLDGNPAVFDVPKILVPERTIKTSIETDKSRLQRVREFILYYQDGLNLWDKASRITWLWGDDEPVLDANDQPLKTVPDCPVCDDSYDRGDYGVNYRSVAFSQVLREQLPASDQIDGSVEASDDLNVYQFPSDYMAKAKNAIRLKACEGEQIVIRVMHPGGRARQRAFAVNGYSYDDLFPGFGFPRSVLVAPGKSISAWLSPLATPGLTVWHDGPTPIRSGGVWGLLDVVSKDDPWCAGQ